MFLIRTEIHLALLLLETGSGDREACMEKKPQLEMEYSNQNNYTGYVCVVKASLSIEIIPYMVIIFDQGLIETVPPPGIKFYFCD